MTNLGDKVKDTVTGYEGIVTGKFDYLNGCRRFCVEAYDKANKSVTELTFDEERLEVVHAGQWRRPEPERGESVPTGGPRSTPPRSSTR